ncbi:MAG TPA: electron transfer flavoprotein subunit alpha/FixB family protein [Flavobacteriales bacterium]|jgi:electron transfer flavoprotein alpha subunit|nr:electron transfer flavoprotein subunit alpha/FixB family protein [Flavobacteriales bacterium]
MAVLVYADSSEGKIPKSSCEAVYYAGKVAEATGTEAIALTVGELDNDTLEGLGNYGVSKVYNVKGDQIKNFDSEVYTRIVAEAINSSGADIIVFPHGYVSKSVGPRLSAQFKTAMVVGIIDYPKTDDGFSVKKTVYSGKAFAYVSITSEMKILAVQPNTFSPEKSGNSATVESLSVDVGTGKVNVLEVNKETDKVPLTEAGIVVSAGRGLKAPENWAMIEEMADLLHAATACSKPVADVGWRPHAEHVGQTGLTVRPNLYFAIGISGAIQHLAGVNGSKVIVAVNTDAEAPIFKAADYGIVGDAFEVVPKLIEAIKKL